MRHEVPGTQPRTAHRDPRRSISELQIRGIGAITLAWNEVEFLLETLLFSGLGLSDSVWPQIAPNFEGAQPKIDLIKRVSDGFHLDPTSHRILRATLDDIALLKRYRDLIVSVRPFEPPAGVSQAIRRSGKKEELLLALDALQGLHERIAIIRRELKLFLTLFGTIRSYAPMLHSDPVRSDNALPDHHSFVRDLANRFPQLVAPSDMIDRDELLIEFRQKLTELLEDIHAYQQERYSLPPLPAVLDS
ncbi:MAG: hypothetical protein MI824_13190 [Hyphomicrobiales bacterium]|nr:hypothetical protein [Hyphomicrobiales bacterium]